MEQACLVTGKSSELLAEVVREAVAHGRRTTLARGGPLELPQLEGVSVVSWNRRSALSARSVVLHAQNTHGRLEEAVIVFSPVRDTVPFHESSIVNIENRVDAEMKGYLFLIRELASVFQKQRSGTLLLAVHDYESEVRSPAEAMALGGFMAAAESLQRFYEREPLEVKLCYSQADDTEAYASFILGALDSPPPRRVRNEWLRFAVRGGFFARPRS